MSSNMEYWVTRHSKSGKGVEEFPGLSEEGVDMAKERAKSIAGLIKDAEDGSVIFYGGSSNILRTKSTMELYASEAERILTEEGVQARFIKKEDIKEQAGRSGYLKTAQELAATIESSPDEKVVIELPLFLKEFSMERYLCEKDGETVKPQWQALLDKHGKNYSEAIKDWFSDPELMKDIDPVAIAKDCMVGMKRLADFSRRFIAGRPIKIGFVGHSFLIDALLTYIANGGQVTTEGFNNIGGDVISETELSTIEYDEQGKMHLKYRGQDFIFANDSSINKEITKTDE